MSHPSCLSESFFDFDPGIPLTAVLVHSTASRRSVEFPSLVIPSLLGFPPLEWSPGTSPRYAGKTFADSNLEKSPISQRNVRALILSIPFRQQILLMVLLYLSFVAISSISFSIRDILSMYFLIVSMYSSRVLPNTGSEYIPFIQDTCF